MVFSFLVPAVVFHGIVPCVAHFICIASGGFLMQQAINKNPGLNVQAQVFINAKSRGAIK
jgi:hypothetical protein